MLLFFGFAENNAVHADYEAIWFGEPVMAAGQNLTFTLNYPEEIQIGEIVTLNLEIFSTIAYEGAIIRMVLLNPDHETVDESEMTLNLNRGRDDVAIKWDPTHLQPGDYTMVILIDYVREYKPAIQECEIYRVSTGRWQQQIDDVEAQLVGVDKSIGAGARSADSSGGLESGFHLRAKIIRDSLASARGALTAQNWREADKQIRYADTAVKELRAGLTFSAMTPEKLIRPSATPSRLEIRDGGFYDGMNPYFLIGAALTDASGSAETEAMTMDAQLAWIKNHGLNLALLNASPTMDTAALNDLLSALARASQALEIPWILQFDQGAEAGALMDRWPDLIEDGFVNLAHEGFSVDYQQGGRQVFSALGQLSRPPFAVSAARFPQFKYDGENIREGFVEQIMTLYPDRQDLNRLWHAHLADFDEITIWGEYPEHSYQNQRAYQHEWQRYHRGLILRFFSGMKQDLSALMPGIPVLIDNDATPFSAGETRTTPSREEMAALMDMDGTAVRCSAGESVYAMNYPEAQSVISLMHSYKKNKPVFILDADIDVSGTDDPQKREALTYSVVWEMVMSGASGMALSPHSTVRQHPEALAAYALAALDVNRLAPIVAAFHREKEQVAVLFSEASKIMDNGVPHLESAQFAFEGASFAGFPVRFITEKQVEDGELADIKVLILPSTMAVPDNTFEQLSNYVEEGGMVARVGTPIPYNERGQSRSDVIRATGNTILVRGLNLPTEYLHALDAALVSGVLAEIVRPVNAYGYPIEGVRSRYVEHDGEMYLYIINLRHTPVAVHLSGLSGSGRDLLRGRDVSFPRELTPLDPMLIHLDKQEILFAVSK
ncbi:MAG: hypothetical protein WCX86_09495 [Candidatus Hydrogenedentales bacterium]